MYRFGPFLLDPQKRLLTRGAEPVPLTPKAFDTLLVLVRSGNRVVLKDDLMKAVWPDSFVEDSNLSQHIFQLRKALGDGSNDKRYVVTVPGRGYQFVEKVEEPGHGDPQPPGMGSTKLPASEAERPSSRARVRWALAAIAVVALLAAGMLYSARTRRVIAANIGIKGRADHAAAIQECQQGRELWRKRHADSLAQAIEHYDKAVALDPSYAPAYSGLADAYVVLPFLSTILPDVAYPKAHAAAEKAVALDPSLAEAHTSLADVKFFVDWDFAGADREFRRALELDPNYATAHQWYAEYLSLMGRHDEAIHEILRAEQLEPLSIVIYHQAGQIYQNARQYDNAVRHYKKALEIDPTFYPSAVRLSDALRHKGMYREALQTRMEFFRRHGESFYGSAAEESSGVEALRHAFNAGGTKLYWRTTLAQQKRAAEHYGEIYHLAIAYAQNGDADNAMLWLNKLYDMRGVDILTLKVEPDFDPIRSDPRFQDLCRRVGLP